MNFKTDEKFMKLILKKFKINISNKISFQDFKNLYNRELDYILEKFYCNIPVIYRKYILIDKDSITKFIYDLL